MDAPPLGALPDAPGVARGSPVAAIAAADLRREALAVRSKLVLTFSTI